MLSKDQKCLAGSQVSERQVFQWNQKMSFKKCHF